MEEKKEEKWLMSDDTKVIETKKPKAKYRDYLKFRKNYLQFFELRRQ